MTKKALTDAAYVRKHFKAMCRHIGFAEKSCIDAEWNDIIKAYGQPHRHYHVMAHVASMLRAMEEFRIPAEEMPRLQAFAIYHDFFYETADPGLYAVNEKRSAMRAATFLMVAGAPEEFSRGVVELIEATKTHKWDAEKDPVGALAIDIDMLVLASPHAQYDSYAAGVRAEFSAFADDVFYPARLKQFLEPTLAAESPFLTNRVRTAFNARAIANMRREKANIMLRLNGIKPFMA